MVNRHSIELKRRRPISSLPVYRQRSGNRDRHRRLGYTFHLKWLSSGDKPSLTTTSNTLSGNQPTISVTATTDGAALLKPIRDDIHRTYPTKPQAAITTNDNLLNGDVPCRLTSATSKLLVCEAEEKPVGTYQSCRRSVNKWCPRIVTPSWSGFTFLII